MSIFSEYQREFRFGFGLLGASMTACCGSIPFMTAYEMMVGQLQDGSIGAGFMGAIFAMVGVTLVVLAIRGWEHESRERSEREERQRTILETARDRGGELTVSELSLETSYTLEEAEQYLDELAEQGVARLDLSTDEGQTSYTFPAFRTGEAPADDLDRELETVLADLEEEEDSPSIQPKTLDSSNDSTS